MTLTLMQNYQNLALLWIVCQQFKSQKVQHYPYVPYGMYPSFP